MLGAAGAVEAIFTILALTNSIVPPTLNLLDPDVDTAFDLVGREPKDKPMRVAMSNSFGFGGTNAALLFGLV